MGWELGFKIFPWLKKLRYSEQILLWFVFDIIIWIYIYISHKFRKSLCKLLDIHWFCHFLAILTRQFGRSLCYCVSILKAAYLFAFASYILSMLHCLLSPLLLLKLIDFHQNQYNPAFLPFCRNSLLWFYTVRLCLILTFNKLCYSIY